MSSNYYADDFDRIRRTRRPREDPCAAVQKTRDGGFVLAGSTASFGLGDYDCWALKLDKAGKIVWQKTYGGTRYDGAWSVQEIMPSGFVFAGKSTSYGAGGDDVLVLRLNKNGDIDASCGVFLGNSAARITKTACASKALTGRQEGYEYYGIPDAWNGVRLPSKVSPTVICKKTK